MKQLRTIIFTALAVATGLETIKAQEIMRIHNNDGIVVDIAITDIQKIVFEDLISLAPNHLVAQRLFTMDLFPNPAKEYLNIGYSLSQGGYVTIEIFSLNGELIEKHVPGDKPAGDHQYQWNVRNVANGLYICTIRQGQQVISRKVVINN